MATKGVVCWLLMVSAVFMGCSTVAGDDETWQKVLTTAGANVVYGPCSTYSILAAEFGTPYNLMFLFGLGKRGDAVRTDTALTLGDFGQACQIYACNDGKLELVDVNSSGTPQNALIRVRFNSTDSYYRLQITEASPAVFVQFDWVNPGRFLCTSGEEGTAMHFTSFPSSSHDHLYEPATIALRQVVDA